MARRIGEAFVPISPETAGFREKVTASLNKQMAGFAKSVNLKADLDTKTLEAKIKAVQAKLKLLQDTGELKLNADTKAFDAKIAVSKANVERLKGEMSGTKLDVDTTAADLKLYRTERQAESVRKLLETNTMEIDTAEAGLELRHLEAIIAHMKDEARNTEFSANMGKLDAQIKAEEAKISELTRRRDISIGLDRTRLDAEIDVEKAKLNFLTRDRTIKAKVDVDTSKVSLLTRLLGDGGGGRGGGLLTAGLRTLTPGGGGPTAAGILPAAGIGAGLLTVLGPLLTTTAAGGLGLGGFGAVAGPQVGDIVRALGGITQSTSKFADASKALHQAISRSPADLQLYRNSLAGIEPDLKEAVLQLNNQHLTWAQLTPAQQAAEVALRNNKDAYKGLLPAQKDALNALLAERSAYSGLSPAQARAADGVLNLNKAFEKIERAIAPLTLKVFNDGLKIANALLPFLAPLARAGGEAVDRLLGAFDQFTKSPGFKNFMSQMTRLAGPSIEAIVLGLGKVAGSVANLLLAFDTPQAIKVVNGFFDAIAGGINLLARLFSIVEPVVSHVLDFIERHWSTIGPLLEAPFKFFGNEIKISFDFITGIVRTGMDAIQGHWGHAWQDMRQTFTRVATDIGHLASGLWDAIVPRALRHELAVIFDGIRHDTAHVWDIIYNNTVGTAIHTARDVEHYFDNVLVWFHRVFGTDIGNFFTQTIPHTWDHFITIVIGVAKDIEHYFNNVLVWFHQVFGTDVSNFFTKTIPSMWDHFIAITIKVADNIEHYFDNVLVWFHRVFGTDVSNFFTRTIPNVWDQFVSLTDRHFVNPVMSAFHSVLNWFHQVFGTDVSNFFTKTIPNVFNTAVGAIGRVWSKVENAVSGPIKAVVNNFIAPLVNDFLNPILSFVSLGHIKLPIPHLAEGGKIFGGTQGKDSVLGMLMPGEVVVPTKMVNEGAVDHLRGKLPGFAAGGVVGQQPVPMASGGVPISLIGYTNPIPFGVRPERIDQGVDFAGSGNVRALGDAKIVETAGGGWPGGPYMSYQLLNGSMKGQFIYLAENIRPTVHPGQVVNRGQTIARMFNGGTGIETGFAAPGGGSPASQLASAGGISGANLPADGATQVGKLFDLILVALGAPPAPNFNQRPGGKLPPFLQPQGSALSLTGQFIQGVVRTLGDIFSGLGKFAKVGIDLAHGDVGAASRALLSMLGANAGGAEGEMGQMLLAIPPTIVKDVFNFAVKGVKSFVSNQQAAAAGPGGSAPPGGATGSEMANGRELYQYLLKNVFAGHKIAAAGAIASIWGESTWNPFAQGTGGRGLIGWTPAGTISNADFSGGMKTQLPAIVRFISSSGDWGVISRMKNATSVLEAANLWGRGVERFGINDVHSTGLALARQIAGVAQGGFIPYATGGGVRANLARQQGIVERQYGDIRTQYSADLKKAVKGSYVSGHRKTLTGELGTLAKRNAAEAAAYKTATTGSGFTTAHLHELATKAREMATTSSDQTLDHVHPDMMHDMIRDLTGLVAIAGQGVPAGKPPPKPKPKPGGGGGKPPKKPGPVPVPHPKDVLAYIAARQVQMQEEYARLTGLFATDLKKAKRGSYVASHRKTITGELGTLAKRHSEELAAFNATSHLTNGTLKTLAGKAKAMATTSQDAALNHVHPLILQDIRKNLIELADVANMGVPPGKVPKPPPSKDPKALLAFDLANMKPTSLSRTGSFGYARGGVISEPVIGFGVRSGASYSFGEQGPETVVPNSGRGGGGGGGLSAGERAILAELRAIRIASQNQGSQFARGVTGAVGRGFVRGTHGGF